MEQVIGDDKSDLAFNTKLACMALLPDEEGKAATWAALIDPNSTDSLKESTAKMSGFLSRNQIDILRPYFSEFYRVLPTIQKTKSLKFLENFMSYMLPTYEIEDSDIVKLVELKNDTPDNEATFANKLQDSIELLIKLK